MSHVQEIPFINDVQTGGLGRTPFQSSEIMENIEGYG